MRKPIDEILLADLAASRWLGRNRKKFVRYWARTERGRDALSDLIDRGYALNWPRPIKGAARNFDATDDRIVRPGDDATLDVDDSDSCALQSLAKLDAVGTTVRVIAGKKADVSAGTSGYMLGMDPTEITFFGCADGVDQVSAGTGAITAGTWYGLTGILKANAAADDDVMHYRNGTLNQSVNSVALGTLATARVFRAGSNSAVTPAQFWDGDISYVRFWKKVGAAWTTNEIAGIVEMDYRLYVPQTEYMELQWVLWDEAASPTTVPDYTDNGFDGTYTGTTFVADPKRVMGTGEGVTYFFFTPVAASINGELTQTLGALTLAATGTLPIVAALSQPLGTLTLASTGGLAIAGTSAATLGAVTLVSTGALNVAGVSSTTLGALTLAATGTLPIIGAASPTLADLTLSATGAVSLSGVLNQALAPVTLTATGTLPASGELTATLGVVTLSANGALALAGALSQELDALTLTATGTLAQAGAGTLNATLDSATLTGTGTLPLAATLNTGLSDLTLAGTGVLTLSGALAATLAPITLEATGAGAVVLTGVLNTTLDPLTLSAASTLSIAGLLDAVLAPVTAGGASLLGIAGVMTATLSPLTLLATGGAVADVPVVNYFILPHMTGQLVADVKHQLVGERI